MHEVLQGSYDYRLVALSVVLAMLAAYAALDLAGRVTATHKRQRLVWLAGGASAMGFGIWAMHYTGMLAFNLPVPVLYHWPTVVVSLLAAVAASAVALYTVSRQRMGAGSVALGSLVMGGGIAAMHYIGMAAMRLPAMMEYRLGRVGISAVVAISICGVALVLVFRARQEREASPRKLTTALIMGSAIPLMHYTGMWAVRFRQSDAPYSTASTVQVSGLGAGVVVLFGSLILVLVIASAFLDRIVEMQRSAVDAALDGEARFHEMAETIPQIVWTFVPGKGCDYCNKQWYDLTGLTEEQTLGDAWINAIHPDDQAVTLQNWEKSIASGDRFEMEYRLKTWSGESRWHLVRATPMRNGRGEIIKWFGSCTDIDGQMQNQAALEEQIREHTAALMEANDKLQTEMRERALAQQELNQQNEKMLRELTLRSQRATTLSKLAELLQSCAGLKDVFSVVGGMAPKIFPELRGAVLLLDASKKSMEMAVSWSKCEVPASVFEPQDCWALRTGHLHFVAAGDGTAVCAHAPSNQNSYFCLPLLSQGEAIGILHFQLMQATPMPESELSLASTFAEQVGLSVANIRLREALRNQSIRDPLTGLYNRRYLEETLERETRRAVRADMGLGVMILDLDHFKRFNDTFGHDAGDLVLKETTSVLVKSVRGEDIVCRYGGEEFVVVLPMTDLTILKARAERIRAKVRELSVTYQGRQIGFITLSIGLAVLPEHGTSPRELLDVADAALYRAKREGRDRVVVGGISEPGKGGEGSVAAEQASQATISS